MISDKPSRNGILKDREYARILLYLDNKDAFLGKKRENQILTFKFKTL